MAAPLLAMSTGTSVPLATRVIRSLTSSGPVSTMPLAAAAVSRVLWPPPSVSTPPLLRVSVFTSPLKLRSWALLMLALAKLPPLMPRMLMPPSSWLLGWSSTRLAALPSAMKLATPLTVSGADWPMRLPRVVAVRSPSTVPPPRSRSPPALTLRFWAVKLPKRKPPPLFSVTPPPVRLTAPAKALPPSARSMLPPLAFSVDTPPTERPPGCWLMPVLLALRSPATVPVPRRSPPELEAVSPATWRLPRLRLPLPVMTVLPPRRSTLPEKAFPDWLSVMLPLPAVRLAPPVTDSAPDWLMALVLVADSTPPTLPLPRSSAPVTFKVRPAVDSVPRRKPMALVSDVTPPLRLTEPLN